MIDTEHFSRDFGKKASAGTVLEPSDSCLPNRDLHLAQMSLLHLVNSTLGNLYGSHQQHTQDLYIQLIK